MISLLFTDLSGSKKVPAVTLISGRLDLTVSFKSTQLHWKEPIPGLFTKKLCRKQGVGKKDTEECFMYSEYALFPYNEALGKISPQNK